MLPKDFCDHPVQPRLPQFDCVVIGASAGGLESMLALLPGLPQNFPCPVVIVQHRFSSTHYLLPEILRSRTNLPVKVATNGLPICNGHIYVAVPNHHLSVDCDGTLRVSSESKIQCLRPSVDFLFQSAAIHFRSRVLAVVLSGMGVDGALGVRAVKGLGGMVIAESRQTAQCPSMPNAAVETECVNLVLPATEICKALISLVSVAGAADWFRVPASKAARYSAREEMPAA